ncbi:DUF4326 domain-containing protein [Mycobacteroides abscessus]|uniref:DUF4326 domain-containing protein n=1 Tax=Mycobacteroides abscessus TaxID=36809 RepID=UPI000C264D1A|nr:DUF4326 domain-containing protein [Mycobacteroides abscessus]
MPQRIQRKRTKGWRMPEGAIYVGRPSRWGNPFRPVLVGGEWLIEDDNGVQYDGFGSKVSAIGRCVALYRSLDMTFMTDADLDEFVAPLRGHDLACWCSLDSPCHADVLLELANDPPSNGEAL